MPFTDQELKELKDRLKTNIYSVGSKTVVALIERMEAAENFILLRGAVIQMEKNTRKIETAYSAWRRAAGK